MIQVGMKHKESVEVTWEMTAEKLGNEGVIVFSTPEMLSFLEITCRHCVEPHLKEGEGTVGISVDLKHMASTPIGMNVTCEYVPQTWNRPLEAGTSLQLRLR